MRMHGRLRRAAILRRLPVAGLLGVMLLLGGCGGSPVVSGKVRYRDQPLTTGEVSFISADGKSRSGLIGADGSYRVTDAPVGPVKVVVVCIKVESEPSGASPLGGPRSTRTAQRRVFSLIPTRYSDPALSDLTVEVVGGKQTWDINLAD